MDAHATVTNNKATAIVNALIGCFSVTYEMDTASASSPRLRIQLLNGSGLVFAAARVL
jgi:hypothetical protein